MSATSPSGHFSRRSPRVVLADPRSIQEDPGGIEPTCDRLGCHHGACDLSGPADWGTDDFRGGKGRGRAGVTGPDRGWAHAGMLCLMVWLGLWSGCASTPWLAERTAREVSKDRLTALADEGVGLQYLGSRGGYHYLQERAAPKSAPFKVDDRALKLGQTFPLHSEEPYEVYPHVILGRRLGQKPRALPGF